MPLTSKLATLRFPATVLIQPDAQNGLSVPSVALVFQMRVWGNGVLKLDKPLDLPEGTEVAVIVVPTLASMRGILKHVQQDSVSLKHSVGEIWAEAMHGGDRR